MKTFKALIIAVALAAANTATAQQDTVRPVL